MRDKHSKLSTIIKLTARIGTGLCIMILIWSCATVPGLQEENVGTMIRIPFVRVLLEDNQDKIVVSAEKDYAIECLKNNQQTVYYSSQPITVENRGPFLRVLNHKRNLIQDNVNEVNIIPRGTNNKNTYNKKKFRGILKLLPNGETVRLINIVYMEDYLRGVVPPEIGKRDNNEIEAVKAQAIAARTYAMAHLQQYPNAPYDMKSSIIDQVYEGVNVEQKLINKAIDATAGEVLFYNDEYVNAYYHSTCGGMTDDIQMVWERKESPYLKAVTDDNACSWSKYFRWKEVFTEQQLRGRIEQYLASDRGRDLRIGTIRDIIIKEHTPGGRISRLTVVTDYDSFNFTKDRIRWVIGRTSNPDLILPSNRFDVTMDRDSQGNITRILFSGSGYGHGVGMCQCGAIGYSRQGWTYDAILTHYYTGTEIKTLY